MGKNKGRNKGKNAGKKQLVESKTNVEQKDSVQDDNTEIASTENNQIADGNKIEETQPLVAETSEAEQPPEEMDVAESWADMVEEQEAQDFNQSSKQNQIETGNEPEQQRNYKDDKKHEYKSKNDHDDDYSSYHRGNKGFTNQKQFHNTQKYSNNDIRKYQNRSHENQNQYRYDKDSSYNDTPSNYKNVTSEAGEENREVQGTSSHYNAWEDKKIVPEEQYNKFDYNNKYKPNKYSQNKSDKQWRDDSSKSDSRNFGTYDGQSHQEHFKKDKGHYDKKDSSQLTSRKYGRSTERDKYVAIYNKFEDVLNSKKEINNNKVQEIQSDLFEMPKEYSLAHCVAEDMNMGSGIAVTFRQKFKKVDELLDQRQRTGGLAILEVEGRVIYYLVTKKQSSGKPKMIDLCLSVQKMRQHMIENNIKKLAIPRIGCGLDRLEWSDVKQMLEYLFEEDDVEITVCNFQQNYGKTKQKLKQKQDPKTNEENTKAKSKAGKNKRKKK